MPPVVSFQKKVLAYTHLPTVFLAELARVADRIPEAQQTEILAVLDESAANEVRILADGYKVIADAEKKVRKAAEASERTDELSSADNLINQSSSFSL